VRCRLASGGIQVFAAQKRRPGVEAQFAVGTTNVGQQLQQSIGMHGQVVMVLHGDRHAVGRGPVAHFRKRAAGERPGRVRTVAGLLVGRKNPDVFRAQSRSHPRQRLDIGDLHLQIGHLRSRRRRQIRVSADGCARDAVLR
jgi:hypothetical protein